MNATSKIASVVLNELPVPRSNLSLGTLLERNEKNTKSEFQS